MDGISAHAIAAQPRHLIVIKTHLQKHKIRGTEVFSQLQMNFKLRNWSLV